MPRTKDETNTIGTCQFESEPTVNIKWVFYNYHYKKQMIYDGCML